MTIPSCNNNVNGAIAESSRVSKSAGLARNWWAIAIRAILAAGFAIGILFGATYAFGTLILVFAAYLVADGIAAIVAGLFKMQRGELWQTLIFEGLMNLFLAGTAFVWPAMAAIAFVSAASIWAVVTGALLLAAARQMSGAYAQALLSLAGLVSIIWGLMVAIGGPSSDSAPDTVGWWLIGYTLPFAIVLLVLAYHLQRQCNETS